MHEYNLVFNAMTLPRLIRRKRTAQGKLATIKDLDQANYHQSVVSSFRLKKRHAGSLQMTKLTEQKLFIE